MCCLDAEIYRLMSKRTITAEAPKHQPNIGPGKSLTLQNPSQGGGKGPQKQDGCC